MPKFNPLDHSVIFEPPMRIAPTTWSGHIPFAMYIVDAVRPETIVELGTQYGVSYCAFCQAVDFLKLPTRCFAVDTWQGDDQTGHYGSDVLEDLKRYHDPLYSGFSTMVQSTFDAAVKDFPDSTIDILHIDGLHTYDAVKNDFQTWLPKMSPRGVILFHDIAVKQADFEVWRFWDEIKSKYPHSDFSHAYGLGILMVGKKYPAELELLLKDTNESVLIKNFFTRMGEMVEREYMLYAKIDERDRILKDIEEGKAWKLVALLRQIKSWLWPFQNVNRRT